MFFFFFYTLTAYYSLNDYFKQSVPSKTAKRLQACSLCVHVFPPSSEELLYVHLYEIAAQKVVNLAVFKKERYTISNVNLAN